MKRFLNDLAYPRLKEAQALGLVFLIAALGFVSVTLAAYADGGGASAGASQTLGLGWQLLQALVPVGIIALCFGGLHLALVYREVRADELILPAAALLAVLGMSMIFRLRGMEGVFQQILRGLLPGTLAAGALILWPRSVERLRRRALWVGLAGLALLFLTALFGVQDETGARLSLRLGPLPPFQTSEFIKLGLIFFLAWYIEREGRVAEGRAASFGWFRLPALRYLAPAALFVGAATLALVRMSDYGAVLILAALFVAMLFSGFELRIFATIASIGLALAVLVGGVLALTWQVPAAIEYRYLAFRNPWSAEVLPSGLTVAEGPGYQIQQSIYAIIAGGVSGTGLGRGTPGFIPLAHSDFILAAIIEELGAAVGVAVLVLYAVLILRLLRLALLLPRAQIFERLLLVGIGVHFFAQALIMSAGTLNLAPVTGVTLPFLSLGGASFMVNLIEIGLALALLGRVAPPQAQEAA